MRSTSPATAANKTPPETVIKPPCPETTPQGNANGDLQAEEGRNVAVWRAGLVLIILSLLLGLGLLIDAAGRLTPTHDEFWHLPIGLAMWETGRFDQDRINPPLVRLWAAAPLWLTGTKLAPGPFQRESDYGDALLEAAGEAAFGAYVGGRWMMAPWWLAGAGLVFLLARQFNATAAVLAVLLWACDPLLLAHGGFVTHDVPAAVSFLLLMWSIVCLGHQPTAGRAIAVGVCLGIAQLVKFTAILLLPLVVVGFLCVWLLGRTRSRWHRGAGLGMVLLTALLVINLGYLFQGTGTTLAAYPFRSERLLGWQQRLSGLGWLPLPVPRDYLLGLDQLFAFMQQPQPVYLAGDWSLTGYRSYYVFCWLYKTPLLLLLGSVTGGGILLRQAGCYARARQALLLTVPPALLLGLLASLSANQLGFRYLLPIYPFLILWMAAGWGTVLAGASRRTQTAVLLGVLLCAAVALRGHPNHLGYFNELAGDQESDIPLLLDSNLDWGQGLLRLSQELTARGETLDGLAYFGSFPPAALDFTGKAPPSYGPQPGRYAVSLNFVHGRPHVLRDEAGQWRIVNLDEFGYLRFFEPRHPTCYGIAIFDLSEQDVARFHRALQQIPGANPSPR